MPDFTYCFSTRVANGLIIVATVLGTASCAAPIQHQSGFLSDYTRLDKSTYENIAVYRSPKFDPLNYSDIIAEETVIVGDTEELRTLNPELKSTIIQHVDMEIARLIKPKGAKTIVGGRKLRVRAAITGIEMPNTTLNMITTPLVGAVTRGGASLDVELKDESTGEIMVAATCSERAHPLWDQFDSYTVLGHARIAISECFTRFEKVYASGLPLNK